MAAPGQPATDMPIPGMGNPATMQGGDTMFQHQQMPLTPPEPEQEESEDEAQEREQEKELQAKNIAEKMDEDELEDIAKELRRGYDSDLISMNDWLTANKEWSKLARQVKEQKTFPWPDASNIKYPLISTAAMQFSARAYPSLVPADKQLVKTRVWGKDPSGEKRKKGERIGTYMSWQITEEMCNWEEEMDKLLIMNAVMGQSYKKTYFDPVAEINVSRLVYPENFIVDYWTRDLDKCLRYSEIHNMTEQEIKERQLRKYFLDEDLGPPTGKRGSSDENQGDTVDYTTPYTIIETHTWLDTDDDGLREPYIVWWHLETNKILRIQSRFSKDDIKLNDKNEVVGYDDQKYYTKFGFIPNPDGSFFDLGFGHLLGPINEAVNTIINQLTDSGTLQNLQGGFISKGLRLNMADTTWKPGEWKSVNATGDDLRKLVVPLPSKEPSAVLFQLLGMLIQAGKELASVAEIFTGKMPGQNTPATTTQATIEQGMKVFTAIYKRIYRSLDAEFKKLFKLNNTYLNPETYAAVIDDTIGPKDFDEDTYDICPTADPTATSQTEKLQKAQAVMELLSTGLIDPNKAVIRYLEALEVPNWQELIPGMAETGQPMPPQQKPDPKVEAIKAKAQVDQMVGQSKVAQAQQKMELDRQSQETKMAMDKQEHDQKMQFNVIDAALQNEATKRKNDIFLAGAQQQVVQKAVEGQQQLQHNEVAHKQKLKQTEETQKSKQSSQKPTSSTGKKARSRNR